AVQIPWSLCRDEAHIGIELVIVIAERRQGPPVDSHICRHVAQPPPPVLLGLAPEPNAPIPRLYAEPLVRKPRCSHFLGNGCRILPDANRTSRRPSGRLCGVATRPVSRPEELRFPLYLFLFRNRELSEHCPGISWLDVTRPSAHASKPGNARERMPQEVRK